MPRTPKFKSLKFKVGLSYFFLNVVSISVFSWVISINQLELISDNSRFQAKELIESIVSSLHKIPLPSSSGPLSDAEERVAIGTVSTSLERLVSNYVVFKDSTILLTSASNVRPPASFVEQAGKARVLAQNSGMTFHLLLSDNHQNIEVYIPLDQIGLNGITVFSRISLHAISDRYRDLYQQIGITVLGMTLLHFLFGIFIYRLLVAPIIALRNGTDQIAKGDYSVKVWVKRNDEIGMLSLGFNQMSDSLRSSFQRLQNQMDQLKVAHGKIEKMAITDELTGLYNRRHFFDYLQKQIAQAFRYSNPLGLVIMDVDHFKKVNDTHGHTFGDRVLREIGFMLRGLVRASDVAARYGGEEIIVMLPETDLEHSLLFAEKIRVALMNLKFDLPNGDLVPVTASFGVAELHNALSNVVSDSADLKIAFVECADKALYRAKESGRNKVLPFDPEDV